jgi:2-polyprenyl-6-methoxyphenol hydroxylase-like FAD-dependent oxidoreductase
MMEDKYSPNTIDVLIVGAGPVGMALQLALHQLGVTAMLVDKHVEGLNTSRAAVIHARTLEVLEPLGVVPAILSKGIKTTDFRVREGERILMHVGFADLPSAYPFALMCPQDETESILLAQLHAVGAWLERPAQLVSTDISADGIIAHLSLADGATREVRARWLVGCDGAHSLVRESAGIEFAGGDYAETFVLADVRMEWPLPRSEVSLFFSPDGLVVVAPLPDERYRIVATVGSSPDVPSISDIQTLLDERGLPGATARVTQLLWSSGFHIQHRVAAQVYKGRVLLCGDAAHVHSPAGGQGMNTGIQDAVALAGPLSQALRNGEDSGIQKWADQRQHVARDVVRMTDALTRIATMTSPLARNSRNAILGFVGSVPFLQKKIALKLAELSN